MLFVVLGLLAPTTGSHIHFQSWWTNTYKFSGYIQSIMSNIQY